MKKAKLLLIFLAVFVIIALGCSKQATPRSEPAQVPKANSSETEKTVDLTKGNHNEDILDSPDTDTAIDIDLDTDSPDLVDEPATSTDTPPTGDTHLTIEYASDEVLNSYESITEFIEFDDEGYQKIIIRPTLLVKDFAFVETGFQDKEDDIVFYVENTLFSVDELSPTEAFVVTWMGWGAIPHRGITFLDENNQQRYFHIIESGMDGSVLLAEFEVE